MFQVNPLLSTEESHEKSSLNSSKDKSKKFKCLLLQFLFGALRVKYFHFGAKSVNDKKHEML